MRGLSPVVASGGHSSLRCTGLSLSRPLLLWSTGSRCAGSVVVAHGPRCSVACGIFPDQGSNPCPLHWQADSQPLHHQGSPWVNFCELCKIGVQFCSFACYYPVFPAPCIEDTVFSPLNILGSLVKYKLTVYVWVDFWDLDFLSLVCVCFYGSTILFRLL